MLASSSEEPRETGASSRAVVAHPTARAVPSRLAALSVEGVGTRGALLLVAGGPAVAGVTEAAYVLHGVPRSVVDTVCSAG